MTPFVFSGWPRRMVWTVLLVLVISGPVKAVVSIEPAFYSLVSEEIEWRIDRIGAENRFACHGERICGRSIIPGIYARNQYRPLWALDRGRLDLAHGLVEAIHRVEHDGLRADDYHRTIIINQVKRLESLGSEIMGPADVAALDLLLTDAFLLLGAHLSAGRVNPETVHSDWVAFSPKADLGKVLAAALAENRVLDALWELRPSHKGYLGLRHHLDRLRSIAYNGGWPRVPTGPSLRPEQVSDRVPVLRERLILSGDLAPGEAASLVADPMRVDPEVVAAVARFQRRHGLEADGIAGRKTLAVLNVPVEERLRQIELNMERWRWIPSDLGRRHILVNIAGFQLHYLDDLAETGRMRIVVGRPARKTPVFSARMTHLVVNPHWYVPHKLAVEDLLPKIKADPGFIARQGMTVYPDWSLTSAPMDPNRIEWHSLTSETFRYRIVQEAGPRNALGRLKFIFPNRFAVYLHDTPAHHLFDALTRDFSSGCIRTEDPMALALWLLRDRPEWNRKALTAAIDSGDSLSIRLPEPVDVHLLYWTAWVDPAGKLHFRQDVYERDLSLDLALRERPRNTWVALQDEDTVRYQ